MAYTSVYEEYLETLGTKDESPSESFFPGILDTPGKQETRNSLYDFLGNAAWGALDEAGFAIPGVIAKKAGIETITPETGLGSAGVEKLRQEEVDANTQRKTVVLDRGFVPEEDDLVGDEIKKRMMDPSTQSRYVRS